MLDCASSVAAAWRAFIKEADTHGLAQEEAARIYFREYMVAPLHNYYAKPPLSSISVLEILKVSV